jgi:chromosome partitioning protein
MSTRIIAVVHSKGGVGKSTLAINLTHEIASRGKNVSLYDSDPQRTAVDFHHTRTSMKHLPVFDIQEIAPDQLHTVPKIAAGKDYAILDTPGSVSKSYREAISIADIILMPMIPGAAEIWAFKRAFNAIRELTTQKGKLVLVCYTQVPPQTSILNELAEEQEKLVNQYNVNFLDTFITRRECWRKSFFFGNTVKDATGKNHNEKAIAELAALYVELDETLNDFAVQQQKHKKS